MVRRGTPLIVVVSLALFGCGPGDRAEAPVAGPSSEGAPLGEGSRSEDAAAERDAQAELRGTVVLVPLKGFADDLTDAVEAALREQLDVEVVRYPTIPLPQEAYYEPRKRYRAEKLLDYLETVAVPADVKGPVKILGLTEVDISTTNGDYKDWGIFGLGSSPGKACVVSAKRLKRRPKDREHVRWRVATTAVHEVGHTFGLPHCDEHAARCVMLDAEGGIENTDASTGGLGPSCRAKLDGLAPRE